MFKLTKIGMVALTLLSAVLCSTAFAHPMGNFSINQYFLVDMRTSEPSVYYMLDIAEIPSFTELDLLDTDFDSDVTDEETETYLDLKVPPLLAKLSMRSEAGEIPLRLLDRRLMLLEGSGGMVVINLVLKLKPEGWHPTEDDVPVLFDVESTNYERESGVRECKVLLDGTYTDSTFDLGEQALKYQTVVHIDDNGNPVYQDFDAQFFIQLTAPSPDSSVSTPTPIVFDWTATAKAAAGTGETAILDGMAAEAPSADVFAGSELAASNESRATIEPTKESFADQMMTRVQAILETKEMSLPMFVTALAIAALMGMGHAFSPGHGKTVMAAYLIGERGTVTHAMILGVVMTITHVWSVLLLGVCILYAGERFSEERLVFWTGIASGIIVVGIGLMLFFRRYATFVLARSAAHIQHDHTHEHSHTHDHGHHHHHDHDHAHSHDHDHQHGHGPHGHSHVVVREDGAPPTYGNILWLGISGGIVPCPAALIVLLLAINLGRLVTGLWLILSFSVGLAAVLVAVGIAVVHASGEVRKRIGAKSPILLALPVVSSCLIVLLGAWLILWTLSEHGVVAIMPG